MMDIPDFDEHDLEVIQAARGQGREVRIAWGPEVEEHHGLALRSVEQAPG